MTYIDGFLIPVPNANKAEFAAQAQANNAIYLDLGALRIVECWREDAPAGGADGFTAAVHAKDDETVVFSWVEWPDRATREAAVRKVQELRKADPRFDPKNQPYPFDTTRMIFSGFTPIVLLEPTKFVNGATRPK